MTTQPVSAGASAAAVFAHGSASSLAGLKEAVKASSVPELAEFNRGFDVLEFPAKTPQMKIFEKITGYDASDIGKDLFKMTAGDKGVRSFAAYMRSVAKEEQEDGDDSGKLCAKIYRNIADETEKAFLPAAQFTSVQRASHGVAEDGDTEFEAIIAQRKDGSFLVLSYANNPF
jgi:hypothetical protein